MSSDVMIVCKEFKNDYHSMYDPMDKFSDENPKADWKEMAKHVAKPKHEAPFIDEASMGDPWNEFGKWFVEKFYNGYDMLDILVLSKGKDQNESNKLQSEIFEKPLSDFDYNMICQAMDEMKCHEKLDKDKVKEYLKLCIGKSISTENW